MFSCILHIIRFPLSASGSTRCWDPWSEDITVKQRAPTSRRCVIASARADDTIHGCHPSADDTSIILRSWIAAWGTAQGQLRGAPVRAICAAQTLFIRYSADWVFVPPLEGLAVCEGPAELPDVGGEGVVVDVLLFSDVAKGSSIARPRYC